MHPTSKWLTVVPALGLLAFQPGCAPDTDIQDGAVASNQSDMRILNGLTGGALVSNALLVNAATVATLTANPLSTTTFSSNATLRLALHDPRARAALGYLVACALPSTAQVQFTDPLPPTSEEAPGAPRNFVWNGELGLAPGWQYGTPGAADQQMVSGCLLSRVNGYGVHVPISLRGHPASAPGALDPHGLSPANAIDPWTGATLARFSPCGAYGVGRDCGWQPSWVGTCAPGAVVTVGLGLPASGCGGTPLGAGYGDTVLRICAGISGCDHAGALAENDDTLSCGTYLSRVAFTCPSAGKFTAMIASYNPYAYSYGYPGGSSGSLPAQELEVFSVREAAWYGNVFDPAGVNGNVWVDASGTVHRSALPQGSVFTKMFACWAPGWTTGLATLTYRVCADPSGAGCAAKVIGPCETGAGVTGKCSGLGADGDYGSCSDDSGASWSYPGTSWLNAPCDGVFPQGPCGYSGQ
jgi:hypothetical protein